MGEIHLLSNNPPTALSHSANIPQNGETILNIPASFVDALDIEGDSLGVIIKSIPSLEGLEFYHVSIEQRKQLKQLKQLFV